jgi:HK97 family phage portal protein
MDWKFWKKTEKKSTDLNQIFREFINTGQQKNWFVVNSNKAMGFYNKNSALFDAVSRIVQEITSIKLAVQKEDTVLKEHQVLEFLKHPNPIQSYSEFMRDLSTYYLLCNNAYIKALGNIKQKPSEIYVVNNTYFSISPRTNGATYKISPQPYKQFLAGVLSIGENTNGRILDDNGLAELVHIKDFSSGLYNSVEAESSLNSILYELLILNSSNSHNISILENGVSINGIFFVDTNDNEVVRQVKHSLKTEFEGSSRAGKHLVAKGGGSIDFKPLTMSNRDMQYSESKADAKRIIYEHFKIPSPLITAEAQTYSNFETSQFALYDNSVLPKLNSILAELTQFFRNRKLLTENESLTYDVTSIPALQLRTYQQLEMLNKIGITSINEQREMIGMDRIMGGDDLYIDSSKLPIADTLDIDDKLIDDTLKANKYSESEIKELKNDYIYKTISKNKKG